MTSLTSFKPITIGPFQSDAKAVNHVKIVGNLLMLVDNDDDPFRRAGGVYLYYINMGAEHTSEILEFLDYLDYADLQIEGFTGLPYIASADLVKPLFSEDEYVIFLTEARTGTIFAFNFHVSTNKQEAVYLQRKMIPLNKLIPSSAMHPTPLRVLSIDIVDYTIYRKQSRTELEFIFLLTVRNWHHLEVMITFDDEYDLLAFELVRLYERAPYPWELFNYLKIKKGSLNASYFAVAYRDYDKDRQFMAVYELPRFKLNTATAPSAGIPITRALGAYRVLDSSEICFDFHIMNDHSLLFNDVGFKNVTELSISKELQVIIEDITPSEYKAENITLTAMNYWTNFSYKVELSFDQGGDIAEKTEIVWVLILIIGFLMIIGLIVVWSRQRKTEARDSIKESLLTVEPEFKSHYINRSSLDPASVRGTVDMSSPEEPPKASQEKLEQEEVLNENIEPEKKDERA